MKVCIIVLDYNSGKYIDACLRSLQKINYSDYTVVVVDSGSTDGSLEKIKKDYPQFRTIGSDLNVGYAGGNNLGLKYAIENNFDAAWIVNPDVTVDRDALAELVKLATSQDKIAVIGSKVYFQKGFEFHKDRYTKKDLGKVIWFAGGRMDWENVYAVHVGMDEVDHGQYDQSGEVDLLTGASMLVKTEALKQVGLIDEKYFLYYEENDLCQKIKQAGWSLWYCPESVVWHANAQATIAGSNLVDYYTTRNRLMFGLRWAPIRTKFSLLLESLRMLVSGRTWQRRGVADYFLGNFGKGSYA